MPGTEVALGALERDYQTKKFAYDQLLLQQQKIGLGADAASQQQGEGIQVVDSANLPSRPVAPKRLVLMGGGVALGLMVGFVLVGLFEVPRLLTIQTSCGCRSLHISPRAGNSARADDATRSSRDSPPPQIAAGGRSCGHGAGDSGAGYGAEVNSGVRTVRSLDSQS